MYRPILGMLGLLIIVGIAVFSFGIIFSSKTYTISNMASVSDVDTVPTKTTPPKSTDTFGTSSTSLRVPIAVYHSVRDISPEEAPSVSQFNVPPIAFDEQLRYLHENNFHTITFAMLHEAITQGTPLPSKPVILSFDDGWRSQYINALPILKKYDFTATFFLYPNVIEHENYMTWDEVRVLRDAGMEIGSHSKSHQYMTKQTLEEQKYEVEQSKIILEEELSIEITSFAYPFGLFDAGLQTMLTSAGYTTARGLESGATHNRDDLYELASYLIRSDFADFTYFVNLTP